MKDEKTIKPDKAKKSKRNEMKMKLWMRWGRAEQEEGLFFDELNTSKYIQHFCTMSGDKMSCRKEILILGTLNAQYVSLYMMILRLHVRSDEMWNEIEEKKLWKPSFIIINFILFPFLYTLFWCFLCKCVSALVSFQLLKYFPMDHWPAPIFDYFPLSPFFLTK